MTIQVGRTPIRQVSRRAPVYRVFRARSYAQSARVAILGVDHECLLVAMKLHLEPREKWDRTGPSSAVSLRTSNTLYGQTRTQSSLPLQRLR
jgi:hypothetical protein